MIDMSAEPTGWWEASTPDYSQNKEESAQSVESVPANDTSPSITTTSLGVLEDFYATSVTSASAPSNTRVPPPIEQANTSPGLPMISLPDPEAWNRWKAEKDRLDQQIRNKWEKIMNASETSPSKKY